MYPCYRPNARGRDGLASARFCGVGSRTAALKRWHSPFGTKSRLRTATRGLPIASLLVPRCVEDEPLPPQQLLSRGASSSSPESRM
jgi:hypothetical protein